MAFSRYRTFNFFASKTKAADEVTVKDGGALVKAEVRSREESGSGGESDNEHDDDNNPKENKIQEVKENDAFYSKRYENFLFKMFSENCHYLFVGYEPVVCELGFFFPPHRCKLFYKKDTSYVEKGVGTLYLKSTDDTTQLLIRAETNLGLSSAAAAAALRSEFWIQDDLSF